jgi:hypothetical protein
VTTTNRTPEQTPRELGPARFQRQQAVSVERHAWRAVGAGIVLLTLVAGLPTLLWWLDGVPPVPTSLPTRADLTAAVGPEQLITVLVGVAWLAWLQFTICVAVELRSALSGVGLPARVPLSGPSQRFARALVGAVLLAATAVGPATAAAAGPVDVSQPTRAAAAEAALDPGSAPAAHTLIAEASVGVAAPDGDVTYVLGDVVLDPDEAAPLLGHKVYRVQPPQGRYHDNLWDIAERHLGDGRRYKEIFELNRGRTQPDGHELSLARLIYPNWLLIMPGDATGLEAVTAITAPAPEPPARAPVSDEPGESGSEAVSQRDAAGATEWSGVTGATESAGAAGAVKRAGDAARPLAGRMPAEMLAAGLLAAGLLAAVETARRRRRMPEPDDDAVEAEVALRVGADPDRVARLDGALRLLAGACADRELPLPPVYAALVDSTGIELLIAPAAADAPAPWQVLDEGRRWRIGTDAPPAHGTPSGVAPYPGLVSLGRDADGRDVLVDLEAASGPIAITGDPGAAYEAVTAIAAELATNRWSDSLLVTAGGLPAELAGLEPSRFRQPDDLAAVLEQLETKRADRIGADVLTGRVRWSGTEAFSPEYIVLGAPPAPDVADRLGAITGAFGRSPIGVVCAGELPGARWRLEIDAAGNLELPVLGLRVTANRLARPTAAAVAALVSPPEPIAGEPIVHEAWLPDVRPEVAMPPVESDTARLATAPVRVFVLGPAEVQAPAEIEDARRELATEIVVHLALHREGVHPTVLAAAIWPRGVTAEVAEAAIERVRDWLGTDQEGSPYLRTAPDGKLRLAPDVAVDWEVVQTLLARSREARSVDEEMASLRRALRVARGPVLAERPPGRYGWLARARLERMAADLLVDAAHRLSMLCSDGGDLATAAAAARAGIRVRPGEQLLWRDLLRVEHERNGRDGVLAVTEDLTAQLAAVGVADLEPETMALLEELLPEPARWSGPAAGAHPGGQVHSG